MPQSSSSRNPQRTVKRRNSSDLANGLRKIRRRSAIIDLTESSPESDADYQIDDSREPIVPPPRKSALGVHAALMELAKVSQQLAKEDKDRSDLRNMYDRVMKDFKQANTALNALRVAFVHQAIDTSAGHCNNCATKFDFNNALESPYILDGCGAPWCGGCCERRKQNPEMVCRHHPSETAETHRLYNLDCCVCHTTIASDLVDIACGHPICRACMRAWTAQKTKQQAEHNDDFATYRIPCPVCKEPHEYGDVMLSATLEHLGYWPQKLLRSHSGRVFLN